MSGVGVGRGFVGSGLPRGVVVAGIAAVVVMAASAGALGWAIQTLGLYLEKKPIQPSTGLALTDLPSESEHWIQRGPDRFESGEIEETLGTENYVTRTYVRKDAPEGEAPMSIDLHVAYYTGSIDTVPHIPERCFVGGGLQIGSATTTVPLTLDDSRWLPLEDVPESMAGRAYSAPLARGRYSNRPGQRVVLPLDPHELSLRVTEFEVPGGRDFYAGYFFIANGGHRASAEGVRLLAFDLKTSYAYYLKVQFNSRRVESAEELAAVASSFLDDMLGELMLCVPDWVEVSSGRWPPAAEAG